MEVKGQVFSQVNNAFTKKKREFFSIKQAISLFYGRLRKKYTIKDRVNIKAWKQVNAHKLKDQMDKHMHICMHIHTFTLFFSLSLLCTEKQWYWVGKLIKKV